MDTKNKVEGLTFKNYHLVILVKLLDTPLAGEQARARNKVLALLTPQLKLNEQARLELMSQYGQKDDKGELMLIEDKSNYIIPPENTVKLNEEFMKMQNEEFVIDILPSIESSLALMTDVILSSNIPFTIQEGGIYDDICTQFEKFKTTDKKSK